MENFLITNHGHWGNDSIPDEAKYALIGMNKTSTGKSKAYAWGLKCSSTPEELKKFIEENLSYFAEGVFKICDDSRRNLIIKTIHPGAWIGTGGRWVKGMSACLKNGRVVVKAIPSIMGDCEHPFTFPRGGRVLGEIFKKKVADKIIGHQQVISSDNSHNYLGDVWGIDIAQAEFDRLRNLQEALKLSAWLKVKRMVSEGEAVQKECESFAYFSTAVEALETKKDAQYFEWATSKAKQLCIIMGRRRGIYRDYIYLGGSCGHHPEKDTEMIAQIRAIIKEEDYDIVPNNHYVGQYIMIRK